MDRNDSADRTEPTLAADAIEPTDRIEPADPTERIEPTEPTDRIDPFDPMLSSESWEPIDHRERWLSLMPGILAPERVPSNAVTRPGEEARGVDVPAVPRCRRGG
jgi:hypothetical protein